MATRLRSAPATPKKYLFEKAKQAALVLSVTFPALSESERATLELMLDKNFAKEVLKRKAELLSLEQAGKLLTLDQL